MADQDRPNQDASERKAEGERWESEDDTMRSVDHDENPERLYEGDDSDAAGGITNRPLTEEVGNQESLPARGTARDGRRNPDATRREGDYAEDER